MTAPGFERLSVQDTTFLMWEDVGPPMHVAAVLTFELGGLQTPQGGLDVPRLRAHLESRLHLMPRYRQRIAYTPIRRQPVWIDDETFNIRYHVRHDCLPSPGTDGSLKEVAGRILSQRLDRAKPLWEVWFVEGLESGRFAMIVKVHHCMVDGVGGIALLSTLLGPTPERRVGRKRSWVPRPCPGTAEMVLEELVHGSKGPLRAVRAARNAMRDPEAASERIARDAAAVWEAVSAGLRFSPASPVNRPVGQLRRVEWAALDLDPIKDLKRRLGGTVNDVILSVAVGAFRRQALAARVPLEGVDYRIVIPVNVRQAGEDAAANRVSAWFLTPPLAEPDPMQRFHSISSETKRLKDGRTAQGTDLLGQAVEWTGSTLLTFLGTRFVSALHPYNLILSNVSGPQFPLYLLGSRMTAMYPQMPLFENQGLGIAVMSYCSKVFWGLIADWDVVPDLTDLRGAIVDSFDELRCAAGIRAPDRRPGRRTKRSRPSGVATAAG